MAACHQANEPKRNAQQNTHYVNDPAYRGLMTLPIGAWFAIL
jgi:hypothetical protein